VTNGCSFTYGDGLDSPQEHSWPAQLAKKLGVDVVNLGRSGSGNDMIFRRTYEYFYEDLINQNNPLYIIMFSSITRKEKWNEKEQHYVTINPSSRTDPASIDYIDNLNILQLAKQSMHYKSSIKNLFLAHQIPYLFSTSIPIDNLYHNYRIGEQRSLNKDIEQQLPTYVKTLNDDVYDIGKIVGHFSFNELPKTKCNHWTVEGNNKVANFFYETIFNKFKDIVIEPTKNYLTVADYKTKLKEPQYK
jgi:hypothetical protein